MFEESAGAGLLAPQVGDRSNKCARSFYVKAFAVPQPLPPGEPDEGMKCITMIPVTSVHRKPRTIPEALLRSRRYLVALFAWTSPVLLRA